MNILDQKEVVGKKSKAPTSEVVDKKSKAPTSIAQIKRQVKHYADWFSAENQRNALASTAREKKDYIESATKVVKVGEKDVMVFAPFRPDHSALQTITTAQVVVLCAIALVCGFGLVWLRLELLAIMMAALTAFYLFHLLLDVIQAALTLRSSAEKQIDMEVIHALKDADWPNYTILCPLYREVEVVPQFVEAMKALEYPVDKLQILLLTEEDDAETRNAMRAMQLPPHFKVVTVPDGSPRTKPRACNYGLMIAMGRYTVIYDAEDIPDPWQLKKAVLTFANHDPDLACVQAKLNFYNPYQNLLTRLFTIEYSLWFDFILPGLQRVGFSLPLGGTSNHFQTQVLRALGGWDAYNVTEDCDLGIRLASYRFKTVVLDSTTYEEANSQLKNWIRQRSRWIKGYMQTYLVQMRHPFRALSKGRFRELASLQLVIAAGMWTFLFNPLLWTLLAVYIAARPMVEGLYHILFPAPVLYMGTLCLIFGNFFYLYLCMIGCMKVKRYHLVKWVLLVPFYWIMMSVAAGLSLFQLIVKPHYWEKTKHGLHLKGKQPLTGLTWLSAQDLAKEETIQEETIQEETLLLTAVADARIKKVVSTITEALLAMPTLSMPAFSRAQRAAIVQSQRTKVRDLWLPVTVITACVASIAAWWYYFQQHETLLYADAYSHLRIARSVVDSATPGFNQLGGVWLPMHHMLMLPFVWNDFLWKTGLAGSIPSMVSYVVAALYLFLFARRFTNDGFACFLGILTFLLNPNI
ncbi:MAG TPA: glycosyltransferase, partial [Ktedonobacteraceae bacterium]